MKAARPRGGSVRPSLSGRLVEVRTAIDLLRAEFMAAAAEGKSAPAQGDPEFGPAWRMLENAADCATAAAKSIMDAAGFMESAQLRGWEG